MKIVGLTCERCGKGYGWLEQEGEEGPRFCGSKCRRAQEGLEEAVGGLGGSERGGTGPRAVPEAVERVCAWEGHPFSWIPKQEKDAPPTYCGPTHRTEAKAYRRRSGSSSLVLTSEEIHAEHVRQQAEAARRQLLAAPPEEKCWACGKVAARSLEEAKALKRDAEAKNGNRNEVRYYECDRNPGTWHWTSMDATLEGWRARQGA